MYRYMVCKNIVATTVLPAFNKQSLCLPILVTTTNVIFSRTGVEVVLHYSVQGGGNLNNVT